MHRELRPGYLLVDSCQSLSSAQSRSGINTAIIGIIVSQWSREEGPEKREDEPGQHGEEDDTQSKAEELPWSAIH